MTAGEFAALSTELVNDLAKWVAEVSKDTSLTASDLAVLQTAMKIIQRVTYKENETKPDTDN